VSVEVVLTRLGTCPKLAIETVWKSLTIYGERREK
jgi:hypothetical protein